MVKFYDTNAILNLQEKVLDEKFVISSVTLHELEHIKTSDRKDGEVKYNARKAIHILDDNPDVFTTVIPNKDIDKVIKKFKLEEDPDNLILACAYYYNKNVEKIVFVSDDICCKSISRNIFGLPTEGIKKDTEKDTYVGFKVVKLNEKEMAYFYENITENTFELLTNEYLILTDSVGEVVDKFRWTGDEYANVKYGVLKSQWFGTVKPYEGDIYQQCVINSMQQNQITMIKGSAGTGKSYLAMAHLFNLLEKHTIDKIVIFCNTVATVNSAKLGFYTGSKDEKLLQSSIGNMLSSKLGGKMALEQLIIDGRIELLPMSDIRGYDTNGMRAGVYITEAQNMDISLMKLALQRISEDCICIIDGDYKTQVDMSQYAGNRNGMRRMSEVFKGQDFYGEIELQNIYRSRISQVAELM